MTNLNIAIQWALLLSFTFAFIPQIFLMLKNKSSYNISLFFVLTLFFISCLAIIYCLFFYKVYFIILFNYTLLLLFSSIMLYIIIKYDKKIKIVHKGSVLDHRT